MLPFRQGVLLPSRWKSRLSHQSDKTSHYSRPVITSNGHSFLPLQEQFPVAARHALPERQHVVPITMFCVIDAPT